MEIDAQPGILRVTGEMRLWGHDEFLQDLVAAYARATAHSSTLHLNLAGVTRIDSIAVGWLARVVIQSHRQNVVLKIAFPDSAAGEMLKKIGVFRHCEQFVPARPAASAPGQAG